MTTNPLFNPYSLSQQYRNGPSSALALALLPTDNFAQKRADAAAQVQYQAMLSGLADQAVAEKEKALADTQATLDTIDRQGLLQTDTRRLNGMYTEKWRAQLQDEIANKYGGDIVKFQRERQPYLVKSFLSELQNAPEFQNALTSKTNYALRQDAIAKGKLTIGNADQQWQDYSTGKIGVLPFQGSYDAPKKGFDYFSENTHPQYKYGMNGRAVEVSQDDLLKHLLSEGLTPAQALDYAGKVGYKGGAYWKMDSQSPWDASKTAFDQSMDRRRANQTDAAQAETRRHNRAQEARDARKDAKEEAAGNAIGTANILFDPTLSVQHNDYGRPLTVTRGLAGNVRDQAIKAARINPQKIKELDKEGYDTGRSYYESTATTAYSLDGKTKIDNNNPLRFRRVYGDEVYFDGAGQPFVKATALLNVPGTPEQERDVLVPLPVTKAATMSANSQAGVNNSKYEIPQNVDVESRLNEQQRYRTRGAAANAKLDNLRY